MMRVKKTPSFLFSLGIGATVDARDALEGGLVVDLWLSFTGRLERSGFFFFLFRKESHHSPILTFLFYLL